jgi:hypothetical protein
LCAIVLTIHQSRNCAGDRTESPAALPGHFQSHTASSGRTYNSTGVHNGKQGDDEPPHEEHHEVGRALMAL